MSNDHTTVLEVEDLRVSYGNRTVIDEVGFRLDAGETVAVVGGSGAGKSTVAKVIAGLAVPSSGSIRLHTSAGQDGSAEGIDLLTATSAQRRGARRDIHLVMQDAYASLPPHSRVLDIVSEPLTIHRLGPRSERAQLAREALDSVGLDPDRYGGRYPQELSGGERQRVAFARAIVTRPAVILADEPTGMLDATLRAEIADLMTALARTHGTAILHITHDLALTAHTCDRVIIMEAGRIVEQGPTREVLRGPEHPMTRRLRDTALLGARAVQSAVAHSQQTDPDRLEASEAALDEAV